MKHLLEIQSEKLEGLKVFIDEYESITIEPIKVMRLKFANLSKLPDGHDLVLSEFYPIGLKKPDYSDKPEFFYLTKLAREIINTAMYSDAKKIAFVAALISPTGRIESETVEKAIKFTDDAIDNDFFIMRNIDDVESRYGKVGVDMFARGCRNEVPRLFILGKPFHMWPNRWLPKDLLKRLKKWCKANGRELEDIDVNIDTVNKCEDFNIDNWHILLDAKHIPPKSDWLILEDHDPYKLLRFYNKKKGRFANKKEFHAAWRKK